MGLVLAIAGMIGLTASAHLFGTPLSPTEKRRASDEWNRDHHGHNIFSRRGWHSHLVKI